MTDQRAAIRSSHPSPDDPTNYGQSDDHRSATADASLIVLSDGPNTTPLPLTQPLTVIGAKHDATIRLTEWHAPKVAAIIARHGSQYVLTPSGSGKRVHLNGASVPHPVELRHGDRIDCCGFVVEFVRSDQRHAA